MKAHELRKDQSNITVEHAIIIFSSCIHYD